MTSTATILLALAGALAPLPPEAPNEGMGADTATVRAAPEDRGLRLTLYDQGFGMVTDVRPVALPDGPVRLEFPGVSPRMQAPSVRLSIPGAGSAPRLLEQSYRRGQLTPERLMEAYVGRTVRVHPRDAGGVEGAPEEAELLSLDGGGVFRMDGRITFDLRGRLSFPGVPAGLREPPTLSWLLEGDGGRGDARVSYLSDGLDWSADYVLSLGAREQDPSSLTGWVTLRNGSGTAWSDAEIALVAGDVRRVSGAGEDRSVAAAFEAARATTPAVRRGELFAYHRYTLERPVTLPDGAEKRVALLESGEVSVTRRNLVRASPGVFRSRAGGSEPSEPVSVVLEMENVDEAGLGVPLPAGVVRVYGSPEAGGPADFLGEDRVGHTPPGETVRITTGRAFDLVAERVQTEYEALGRCASESAWEIRLRNRRDEAAAVRVLEPVSGEWDILSSSHRAVRVDAGTFRFDVEVPPEGAVTIRYRVRVSWC